jgi:hypothetical protein
LQKHSSLARFARAQLAAAARLRSVEGAMRRKRAGILKTNCRDRLDHVQPCAPSRWGASCHAFSNYCRGAQEIQDEFRSFCDETRARTKIATSPPAWRHMKLESTVRYLGVEVDDALEMAEQTEV